MSSEARGKREDSRIPATRTKAEQPSYPCSCCSFRCTWLVIVDCIASCLEYNPIGHIVDVRHTSPHAHSFLIAGLSWSLTFEIYQYSVVDFLALHDDANLRPESCYESKSNKGDSSTGRSPATLPAGPYGRSQLNDQAYRVMGRSRNALRFIMSIIKRFEWSLIEFHSARGWDSCSTEPSIPPNRE